MNELLKQLAILAELRKQATPTPWQTQPQDPNFILNGQIQFRAIVRSPSRICSVADCRTGFRYAEDEANAAFIAAVGCLDFAELIREIERLKTT